jgi:ribosomal protein L12E/L44/L45/RPP1/RPP2
MSAGSRFETAKEERNPRSTAAPARAGARISAPNCEQEEEEDEDDDEDEEEEEEEEFFLQRKESEGRVEASRR